MSLRILVTEDEAIVRRDIKLTLERMGYEVVATADTGEKAIAEAKAKLPDLALMDIMLKGEMTGIEAAAQIKTHRDIPVIFLTAYADESMLSKAQITDPHGYIIKPFKEIDLRSAIEIAIRNHRREGDMRGENEFLKKMAVAKQDARYLFIKLKGRLQRLNPADIVYIEALKDYVNVVTTSGSHTIHSTMKEVGTKLNEEHFVRVHRSYFINMDHIDSIKGSNLVPVGIDKEIPIGGSYRETLTQKFNLL